jgi:predicted RNA-binding Zn-ribbon protein involved in translation (DUF1610 family)
MIEDWDTGAYYARGMHCINCYNSDLERSMKSQCAGCGRWIMPSEGRRVDGKFYCDNCGREEERRIERSTCAVCKRRIKDWEEKHPAPEGKIVCDKCYRDEMDRLGMKVCYKCGKTTKVKFVGMDGNPYCLVCWGRFGRFAKEKTLAGRVAGWFGRVFRGR